MSDAEQITQLEAAIASLEAQRPVLGDHLVDAALAPLRAQLASLQPPGGESAARQPAAPATPTFEGERKLVTIMFADISGFTAMSEKLDPEQVRSLMNACFDHLTPTIEKYDGVVDKFIGDEIMALFGAPAAHENDPERALRAALEMAERLAEFNAQHHIELGLHFGINTGMVIAGGIGSQQQQQYSVMGDAVNVASRLEDASDRGEIFVGVDTHRLTAPLFEFEELPPVRVKGKVEPVPVFRLIGTRTQPGKLRGLAGLESVMVGRSAELTELLQMGASAASGQGCAAIITGEPGLGKTRLVTEWKTAAAQPALHWAEGRCLSYGQGLAYHLVIDLLRNILEMPAAASEAETNHSLRQLTNELFGESVMEEVYPYLGHLLSLNLEGAALEHVQRLDPQALQAQYLAAFSKLLLALASRQPLGPIFDDIHWADPSSTDLILKLLPLATQAPILFCFVTRPEPESPGWRIITALQEKNPIPCWTEISLRPLSESESRQLVSNLLEIETLPEAVRTLILKKAEGNPFFVEEVIRMLIDDGIIVRTADRAWITAGDIQTIEIPDTLQSLLLARIDRLPEEIKRTLRVASVIGRQFSAHVLAQVLEKL